MREKNVTLTNEPFSCISIPQVEQLHYKKYSLVVEELPVSSADMVTGFLEGTLTTFVCNGAWKRKALIVGTFSRFFRLSFCPLHVFLLCVSVSVVLCM